jgi:uncharacterized protein (TIGR02246 family)
MLTRLLPLLLVLLAAPPTVAGERQSPTNRDEAALTSLVERWTEARSANDAAAMRPLYAEKVDRVVLPSGTLESTTREQLITYFADGFKGSARGTHARTIAIRPVLLSSTAALVDHMYEMYGAGRQRIGVGFTTFVAVKDGAGSWRIAAMRYVSAWPQARAPRPASDK